MALIRFENVNFTYPGAENKALDNINIEINDGDFVLICGPSGCGKTTLIKQLLPEICPYGHREGRIVYYGLAHNPDVYDGQNKGCDLDELSPRDLARTFGFVGQNPQNQMVTDKVWHELAFGMENIGTSQEIMERRIAEICEFFGMQSWLNKDVASLSGGEMQMVHLAAVMVMEPRVLILDEPTGQLDPLAARNFLDMLARINQELGTTIILVEHHLEEAYAMADMVVAMDEASVKCVGNPRDVAGELGFRAGLPSALIIAKSVLDGAGEKMPVNLIDDLPLNVAEGQKWLRRLFHERTSRSTHEMVAHTADRQDDVSIDQIQTWDVVLKTQELCFAYDEGKAVLQDCSFSIFRGEIFTLLGGNGTGKSTLLKLLSTTLKPAYGTIEVLGRKLGGFKDSIQLKRKGDKTPLGYEGMVLLPQDPMALFTEITVWDELKEVLDGLPYSFDEKNGLIAGMLEQIRLTGYEKRHPYDLSGGQQQMLAIGKLLLLKPRIILMDEPTKGLDYDRKIALGHMIAELASEGISFLIVSHDIEFAARFAHRCGLMHDGRIVAVDRAKSFFAGNSFFTTAANRMARRYFPEAILPEEVIELCKKELVE
ncbi:MAG: ATP-binding cassette domain-containing protein [Lachnospiraceae bacterium]|nr:ATP-binding cassette domain-containing protein [Lachnospiraceae bacterium]